MKIVSWNISESKPWKVDYLMGLNADVLVAPEITCPDKACISDSYDIKWYGIEYFFHQKTGEQFGHETKATYFHRFQESDPYFLDYAYTNFDVASFRLLPWNKEMSDHVGLEVIF
jgi:hypothetical protein